MPYILMHKDIKVMCFELTPANRIGKILEIYDFEHLPFSTKTDIRTSQKAIAEWWSDRSIPVSRDDYFNIQKALPGDTSMSLVVKARALSLNDQYWIKREDEELDYDDVSLFTNKYSNDIGDVIIGIKDSGDVNYYSPDSTSNGNLKKRWKSIEGKNYLLKAGSGSTQYEIFNEIIASKIMDMLGIEHVKYELVIDHDHIYCASSNFVSYNEDFVTAYQLRASQKQKNDASLYAHILSVCEALGVPNYKLKMNQMLFVDYLVGNVDRHLNNFGVLRDAKTLEFLRVAPIYDTGSCLGFDMSDQMLSQLSSLDWKPFQSHKIKDQLMLIDDYSWLDVDALKSIPKEIDSLMLKFEVYLSTSRRSAILDFLVRRINNILQTLGIAETITYITKAMTPLEKIIIDYFKKHNGELHDLKPLLQETGYAYITVYRVLSKLVEKGIIKRTGSKKTGYWMLA